MLKKIQNLFSEDQVINLKKIINDEKKNRDLFVWDEKADRVFPAEKSVTHTIQNPALGKIGLNLNYIIPEDIKNTLISLAESSGYSAYLNSVTYTEYSPKYGIPELRSHKDTISHFWLIDYQLEANTDWDIEIDGEVFTLKDNEAIAFYPGLLEHGRPQKTFNSEEFVSMIFFDMIVEDITEKKEFIK